jgi:hypothetical protein
MKPQEAMSYLQGKYGYEPHLSAGIISNLMQESSLNPTNVNKQSGNFGLAQWGGDRKKALISFATEQGKPVNDPYLQLDFLHNELQGTEKGAGKALATAQTAGEAATIFSDKFERAGQNEKNNTRRASLAEKFLGFIIPDANASETPYQAQPNEKPSQFADAPKGLNEQQFYAWRDAQKETKLKYSSAPPNMSLDQFAQWRKEQDDSKAQTLQQTADQQFTQEHQQLQAAGNNPDAPIDPRSWGTVASKAVHNLPSSAMNFGENIAGAVSHPIDTLEGLGKLVIGGIQSIPGATVDKNGFFGDYRPVADKVGAFYKDRYGSMDGFKYALGSDPVGVLSDLSAVLGIGAGGLGKVAEIANIPELTKAVNMFSKASEITNPINAVVKPVAAVTTKALPYVLGMTTGAGADSIKAATAAGVKGGQTLQDFQSHMRGTNGASFEDIVTDAKGALGNIRTERSKAYQSGMTGITSDPTVLDFSKIMEAADKAMEIGNFKGKVINRSAGAVNSQIMALLDEWNTANPAEFHTAAGIDALKQAIGDVRDSTQFGTPARLAADRVYQAAVAEITKQAPDYARVMKDYGDASKQLNELTKTFSLGEKASKDTAIRKMQSMTRNNVNTNFGARNELGKVLEKNGADNLMSKVAGQGLNNWMPRGIAGGVAPLAAGAALVTNPVNLGLLAFQSPRLMGEVASKTGQLISPVHSLANTRIAQMINHLLMQNAPYLNSAYQQGGQQ